MKREFGRRVSMPYGSWIDMFCMDYTFALCYHSSKLKINRKGGWCICVRKDASTATLSRLVASRNFHHHRAVNILFSLLILLALPCFSCVSGIVVKRRSTPEELLIRISIWLCLGLASCYVAAMPG